MLCGCMECVLSLCAVWLHGMCVEPVWLQGVAVAWGAKLLGCRSIVYMHSGSSEIRAQMVRDLGGVVMRCEGE